MIEGDRAQALARLESEPFDLLVIGGGIIGSRIAYEAARGGARVALVDAGDFGGATSSASSKLIHGGLRYLQMADFRLVREAHAERRALEGRIAPHLVTRRTFVVPVYRGGPHRTATVAAGMLAYAALSGFRHNRAGMVGPRGAKKLAPSIQTDGMTAAGVYQDAQTHDSRLVLATVTAAARAGAVVCNHLPVEALDVDRGLIVAARADRVRISCQAVVNAAGPWVDDVRRLEDASAAPIARLSKGVHVVLDQPEAWSAAITTPLEGGRVSFAIPWEEMLLLGTTDTEFDAEPEGVDVAPDDVETVLAEASRSLPEEVLRRDRIRYAFAGLRVLPRTPAATARASREELVTVGPRGMVSVAGGKLTTHRRIALKVLQHLGPFRHLRLHSDPLPGAGPLPRRPSDVPPATWRHLTHLYGNEAPRVVEAGSIDPVHPDGPPVWAQVEFAIDREWALTVDDVVRRRTTLEISGLATPEVRSAIRAALARRGASED